MPPHKAQKRDEESIVVVAIRRSTPGVVDQIADRDLMCVDCGVQLVFIAGESLFFHEKKFMNDPNRCKQRKARRTDREGDSAMKPKQPVLRAQIPTTVPFTPTQGRPVLGRACYDDGRLGNHSS
jgi:CxxC-x17-CxxC domain-containing protein